MNALYEIINLPKDKRAEMGVEYTPSEIAAQPRLWVENFETLKKQKNEILDFLAKNVFSKLNARVILTGAGSSAHVGLSVQNLLRFMWQLDVDTRPTTDIVTHWDSIFLKNADNVLVSFARSGNSPESMAAIEIAEMFCPKISHIVVTCNKDGATAQFSRKRRNALLILLSEETNDKGLAMTASFTTMLMTAQFLAYIKNLNEYEKIIKSISEITQTLFDNYSSLIKDIANTEFERAVFLGSGCLYGCAVESALKLQEMTDGKIICKADTFLGVRHGPEAVVNDKTLVVYFLSSDPFVRKYELDLMKEIKDKDLGMTKLVVCDKLGNEAAENVDQSLEFDREGKFKVPDPCRPLVDVTVGQMLGLFKSLAIGLKPDNPSVKGVINRVVKGVKIYHHKTLTKTTCKKALSP
ncbi:SIS domain-containing protein [Candidatus Bathyarchaeota archaeon]|nr:SIS domain-containing protein [Candidatus Bathyarchaeota archaeon]